MNTYGKTTWSMSAYSSNTTLIENYISPIIGNMKLSDITARVLGKNYMQLLKTPSVHRITQKKGSKDVVFVAPPTSAWFDGSAPGSGLVLPLPLCYNGAEFSRFRSGGAPG